MRIFKHSLLALTLIITASWSASALAQDQSLSVNISAETDPFEGTTIEMTSPTGARCQITANKKTRDFTVPFQFPAQAGTKYSFDCTLTSGTPWRWSTEPKVSQAIKIRVEEGRAGAADPFGGEGEDVRRGRRGRRDDTQPTTGPHVIPPPAPPLPPPAPLPPPPEAMSQQDFQALLATVKAASFSSDRINALRAAASRNHFTVDQLGVILKSMTFASDFSDALKIIAPKVVDPQNAFKLHQQVTFSSQSDEINRAFGL
jgi:hypothetical protein